MIFGVRDPSLPLCGRSPSACELDSSPSQSGDTDVNDREGWIPVRRRRRFPRRSCSLSRVRVSHALIPSDDGTLADRKKAQCCLAVRGSSGDDRANIKDTSAPAYIQNTSQSAPSPADGRNSSRFAPGMTGGSDPRDYIGGRSDLLPPPNSESHSMAGGYVPRDYIRGRSDLLPPANSDSQGLHLGNNGIV